MSHKYILFIDFDGVLHATHGPGHAMRQFVWLPVLLDLLRNKSVGVVVHASARQTSPAEFLRDRLRLSPEMWCGVTDPKLSRWESILKWVDEHRVTNYRILDDQPGEFASTDHLIVCDERTGVSSPDVRRAILAWLGA